MRTFLSFLKRPLTWIPLIIAPISGIFTNQEVGATEPTLVESVAILAQVSAWIALGISIWLFLLKEKFNKSSTSPAKSIFGIGLSVFIGLFVGAILSGPSQPIRFAIDPSEKMRFESSKAAATASEELTNSEKEIAAIEVPPTQSTETAREAPSNTPVPGVDVTTEAEKAAAEKAAAEKAAPPKTDTSSEKLAGFDAAHIRSFKAMVSNIRAYVSAVNSGNTIRSSQVCDVLDDNYNGGLRGVYTRSSNTQIQDLLDFAKDYMYTGVVDCTRGFRKGRVDLIGDSVTAFIAASKYLDGLVLASQVK